MEARARWALVLAGGDGTRLLDVTREVAGRPIPKQYCRLLGDRTLLDATLSRTALFTPPRRSLVLVNRNHLAFDAIGLGAVPERNIVVQPCNRDTGPAIVLGLIDLARRDPDALVAMFPSDHYIGDDALFMEHVDAAAELVSLWPERVAVLGAEPEEADSDLGYIALGRRVASAPKVYAARRFEEKPKAAVLGGLLREGALCNTLVMVFRVRRILELLRQRVPREFARVRRLAASPEAMATSFGDLPAWNFSGDFLSKIAAHLVVVRVEGVYWSDWGTRAAIERTMSKLNQPLPWQVRGAAPAA